MKGILLFSLGVLVGGLLGAGGMVATLGALAARTERQRGLWGKERRPELWIN